MREPRTRRTPKTLAFSAASDNDCLVNYETVGRLTESSNSARVRHPHIAWRGQESIVDRFWKRVNKNGPVPPHRPELGPCWQWTGLVVARYGQISLGHPSTPGSKRWKTHRFSWELHHGAIPEHLRVMHQCDNCLCVNPAHLELGTQKQNVHDAIHKGRRNAFGQQKLTPDDVRVIRAQAARGILHKDIARAFGIGRSTVSGIVSGRQWAHLDAPAAPAANPPLQPEGSASPVAAVDTRG